MKIILGVFWLAALFPFWVFQTVERWPAMDFITSGAFVFVAMTIFEDGLKWVLEGANGH